MINPAKPSSLVGDIERQYPTVVDSGGDRPGGQPLTVKLGDLWSDFVRVAHETRYQDGEKKASSAVPILDDMKGILQWD